MSEWQFDDVVSPADYLSQGREWVHLVGGCCGTEPEHIRALRDGLPTRVSDSGRKPEGARNQLDDRP